MTEDWRGKAVTMGSERCPCGGRFRVEYAPESQDAFEPFSVTFVCLGACGQSYEVAVEYRGIVFVGCTLFDPACYEGTYIRT